MRELNSLGMDVVPHETKEEIIEVEVPTPETLIIDDILPDAELLVATEEDSENEDLEILDAPTDIGDLEPVELEHDEEKTL